jgi:hypothetical protein
MRVVIIKLLSIKHNIRHYKYNILLYVLDCNVGVCRHFTNHKRRNTYNIWQ